MLVECTAEQAVVASITLLPQFRFRRCFEPAIEKFIERDLGSLETAAKVAFAQHLGQILLGAPGGAVDGAVVVAPPVGLAVAAEEDTDKPALAAASYDLSETTRQKRSSETWHTGGTLPWGEPFC